VAPAASDFSLAVAKISQREKEMHLVLDVDDTTPFKSQLLCNFQRPNVTWGENGTSSVPDFTICFERTVLVWAPCAFLWIFSCFEVFYILNSRARDIPFTWLNISKFVRFVSCKFVSK
jgi:hypothetical protein